MGNTKATVNLGVLCQQQGDIKKANQLYEEAHKKGDATATSNLQEEGNEGHRAGDN